MSNENVLKELDDLHDKAANNVTIVCKKFYISLIKQEIESKMTRYGSTMSTSTGRPCAVEQRMLTRKRRKKSTTSLTLSSLTWRQLIIALNPSEASFFHAKLVSV